MANEKWRLDPSTTFDPCDIEDVVIEEFRHEGALVVVLQHAGSVNSSCPDYYAICAKPEDSEAMLLIGEHLISIVAAEAAAKAHIGSCVG